MRGILTTIGLLFAVIASASADEVSYNPTRGEVASVQAAANQGDVKAQYRLGYLYFSGASNANIAVDLPEAVKWWEKAAAQNYPKAEFALGTAYANGQGVTMDVTEAVKWWRKAGEQGLLEAQ